MPAEDTVDASDVFCGDLADGRAVQLREASGQDVGRNLAVNPRRRDQQRGRNTRA